MENKLIKYSEERKIIQEIIEERRKLPLTLSQIHKLKQEREEELLGKGELTDSQKELIKKIVDIIKESKNRPEYQEK